jgi:uncharacterized protein (TIGR01777 family)
MNEEKILLTGGTGFIGSKLSEELLKEGYKVTILSRKNHHKNQEKINYISDLDQKEFDYDIVINLCGEPISCRWSETKKKEIYDSRIKLTQKLAEKIINSNKTPKLFISGSAIGYYGTSPTQIFQEKTLPTNQNLFSQKVCFDWEAAAKKTENKTRLVIIRTGVVIGQDGGIIKKMLLPFKLGLGGKIASGNQPMSWIHLEDEVGAILHIINNSNIRGAVNLCSESSTTNREFSMQLAKSLQRPCLFTIPGLSMKLIYGEMADELLLAGQKVYPRALLESGYKFKFSELEMAINQALQKL